LPFEGAGKYGELSRGDRSGDGVEIEGRGAVARCAQEVGMTALRSLTIAIALPLALMGQVWLSPKGEGVVTALYQNDIERLHSYGDGRTRDRGHTTLDATYLETDFSLTDKLAVKVSVPFIEGKYVGSNPHLLVRGQPSTAVALDDGNYHGGLQDFRFQVRYLLRERGWRVAPFVLANLPSHDYSVFAHAATGINETEYRVGVSVGRRLDPLLKKAFLQGQYAFGMSPLVAAGVAPKRSYGELQLGYLLNSRFSIQGSSVLLYSHNGINFDYNLWPNNVTVEQYLNHDRISQSKLLDAAVSFSYRLSPSMSLFASAGHSYWGTNGHLRYIVSTVGFSKAFTTKLSAERNSAMASLPESRKAMVCTCAKK
jgi:hypothetical protein